MAARLHPLDHQRIDARAHQLLRERKGRREADDLRARGLDRLEAALGWQAPCEHDMADAMFCAHLDQLEELGVHGDKVDAKIARREFFRRSEERRVGKGCVSTGRSRWSP